ncbi:hypothetical protein CRG98_013314 [Punica granatum]|uniref:Uncharacterized protein n=1 Tax=Punica granatum TaxID=22663 RepID=A0A2I0KCM5_PUNGR|nr:hypothetical protein CRG98_013314 [Punica granatum]
MLEFPIDSLAGIVNRRPRPLHRGHQYPQRTVATSMEGSGSLIGGPNSRIYRELRLGTPGQFRGCSLQSATPTPPSRSPIPTGDADDLGGGVGSPIGGPDPSFPFDFLLRTKMKK